MRFGENERILYTLMINYPEVNNKGLELLFYVVTHKRIRMETVIHSLEIKGIIESETGKPDKEYDELYLSDISIDPSLVKNLHRLETAIKLGQLAKSVLYLIGQTQNASLQFIIRFFGEKERSIYSILQRLEQRDLIVSYSSRIRHTNSIGRRYRPKYYTLTNLGSLWLQVFEHGIQNKEKINEYLKAPQEEIKDMVLEFKNNKK